MQNAVVAYHVICVYVEKTFILSLGRKELFRFAASTHISPLRVQQRMAVSSAGIAIDEMLTSYLTWNSAQNRLHMLNLSLPQKSALSSIRTIFTALKVSMDAPAVTCAR